MAKYRFALQLYTVRDHLDKDIVQALMKVKGAGYDYVEIASMHGLTPKQFKQRLKDALLKPISMQNTYTEAVENTENAINIAKLFEIHYIVVGGVDPLLTTDKDAWIECGKKLEEAGAHFREAGLRLCFHNHAQEFRHIEGTLPLDILLTQTAPEHVSLELDTFWIQYAGFDPATIITKYTKRCPLIHVKDMADFRSRAFKEMGQGILDWKNIFAAAENAGTRWYIVEQDTCARDSIDSARMSAIFMAQQ